MWNKCVGVLLRVYSVCPQTLSGWKTTRSRTKAAETAAAQSDISNLLDIMTAVKTDTAQSRSGRPHQQEESPGKGPTSAMAKTTGTETTIDRTAGTDRTGGSPMQFTQSWVHWWRAIISAIFSDFHCKVKQMYSQVYSVSQSFQGPDSNSFNLPRSSKQYIQVTCSGEGYAECFTYSFIHFWIGFSFSLAASQLL